MSLETLRRAYPNGFFLSDVRSYIARTGKDPYSFIKLLERRGIIETERTKRGLFCRWISGGKWRLRVEVLNKLVNEVPEHNGEKWERQEIPESMKRQILRRDHYRCRICGRGMEKRKRGRRKKRRISSLVVHHIVPDGPSTPDNLITLCRKCHLYVHAMLNSKGWPYSPFFLAKEGAE